MSAAVNRKSLIWFLVLIAASALLLGGVLWHVHAVSGGAGMSGMKPEKLREYANRLKAQGLTERAEAAYEEYVREAGADSRQSANIYFTVGEMFLNAQNYENALAYFIKAETVDPDTSLKKQIGTHMVTCLERLGKDLNAEYEVQSRSALKGEDSGAVYPGEVVAVIGLRDITMGELNARLDDLPKHVRDIVAGDEASKLKFLEQYVAQELLYAKGKKLGLHNDPEVNQHLERLRKELVVQKVLQDELKEKSVIDPADVENFYEANQDHYTEAPEEEGGEPRMLTFDEAKERVLADYRRNKDERLLQQLVSRLLLTKSVKIYRERFDIQKETDESEREAE